VALLRPRCVFETRWDGRYLGSALTIAARVAAHARAGQISCAARVASAAADLPEVRRVFRGALLFKNVPQAVEVFELVSATPSNTVVDAVCHMQVEVLLAPARLPFNDRTYYFCSLECAETFAQDPRAYWNRDVRRGPRSRRRVLRSAVAGAARTRPGRATW
jgi:adenylate cyclase